MGGDECVGVESYSDQYLWMRFMAWYGRIGVWAGECVAEIRVLCALVMVYELGRGGWWIAIVSNA